MDFRSFFSRRGILLNYDIPGQPDRANAFGVDYLRVTLDPATGWTNVPTSFSPAKEERLTVTTTFAAVNPTRLFDLYIYDSTNDNTVNYDHVLVVPAPTKNGAQAVANLSQNQWADVKVTLIGARAGQTAGLLLKAIDLAPDLSRFRLYFTSVTRVNATYNALGPAGSAAFEETLAHDFPTSIAADFAPLEGGIVDEDTYVEQGLKWADAHYAYLHYIFETLGVEADLLHLGTPITDEFRHQFTALFTPRDLDNDRNPYYDDVEGDGIRDNRVAIREGYIRAAYEEADETLALGRELMGAEDDDRLRVLRSRHGSPVVRRQRRQGAARRRPADRRAERQLPLVPELSAESAAGAEGQGLLRGRDGAVLHQPRRPAPGGHRPGRRVRERPQPDHPGVPEPDRPGEPGEAGRAGDLPQGTALERRRLQLAQPDRSGDVVVVTRPPYQFDAATPGQRIAFSQFFGQHGYLPNLVNLARNVNMHGTFVASGPGVRGGGGRGRGGGGRVVHGVRAIDVAPTIAFLMDIDGPAQATGVVLDDVIERR